MKHLKHFESNYYTPIEIEEITSRFLETDLTSIDFTKWEKKELSDLFHPFKKYSLKITHGKLSLVGNYDGLRCDLTIWKVDDDYFYVKYSKYGIDSLFSPKREKGGYICDQFDGLKRLIEEEISKWDYAYWKSSVG
jgi:hypothetical protein